jgi:hypothetical protein
MIIAVVKLISPSFVRAEQRGGGLLQIPKPLKRLLQCSSKLFNRQILPSCHARSAFAARGAKPSSPGFLPTLNLQAFLAGWFA